MNEAIDKRLQDQHDELRRVWHLLSSSCFVIDNHKKNEYGIEDLDSIKDDIRERGIIENIVTLLCGNKQSSYMFQLIDQHDKAYENGLWASRKGDEMVFKKNGIEFHLVATDGLPEWRMIVIPEDTIK